MGNDVGISVTEDALGGEDRGALDFFFFFPVFVVDVCPSFGCFVPLLLGDFVVGRMADRFSTAWTMKGNVI